MSEYIERDGIFADIDELKKSPWYTQSNGHFEREEAIDIVTKLCILKQPSADVAPAVHGRWIKRGQDIFVLSVERKAHTIRLAPLNFRVAARIAARRC